MRSFLSCKRHHRGPQTSAPIPFAKNQSYDRPISHSGVRDNGALSPSQDISKLLDDDDSKEVFLRTQCTVENARYGSKNSQSKVSYATTNNPDEDDKGSTTSKNIALRSSTNALEDSPHSKLKPVYSGPSVSLAQRFATTPLPQATRTHDPDPILNNPITSTQRLIQQPQKQSKKTHMGRLVHSAQHEQSRLRKANVALRATNATQEKTIQDQAKIIRDLKGSQNVMKELQSWRRKYCRLCAAVEGFLYNHRDCEKDFQCIERQLRAAEQKSRNLAATVRCLQLEVNQAEGHDNGVFGMKLELLELQVMFRVVSEVNARKVKQVAALERKMREMTASGSSLMDQKKTSARQNDESEMEKV